MANQAHTAGSRPEYQHFVPQFMLRNFAHKYSGPQRTKKGKKNKKDAPYRGDQVVNNVNLKADPVAIEETKVARIFGQYDMYQDTAKPTAQQREIEKMLGNLENHVSIIFRKIVKAFESGDPSVWVTREERNSIRKFLFILKYRGSTFHQRFHHDSSDEYNFNDKERLHKYMEDKKLKRPVDVWFHGLKTIMNLKMDTENWQQQLIKDMYQDDAMWFLMHSEMMYMAICTPSNPEDEFILTSNSYNVFEGPNTFVQDPVSGKSTETGWTSFHEFAPLSPKLMIILRSNLLPVPEEDSNPEIREWREEQRNKVVSDWYGAEQQSSLADLPIRKARNSYSQIVNGRVQMHPGEDGSPLKSHKFCFSFFPVSTEHVNKINYILFDNTYHSTNIVFKTQGSFLKTLEWYMTIPATAGKTVVGDSAEARRKVLMDLAALMKSLGSTLEPVWTDVEAQFTSQFAQMQALQRSLQTGMLDWMLTAKKEMQENPQLSRGPKFAYISLGGTNETFFEDVQNAQLMLKRRIKIDVHSNGQPEEIRDEIRRDLIDEYLRYPSPRVLFFIHRVRLMVLGNNDERYFRRALEEQRNEPEDIIAQALHDKMEKEKINRLMYKAAMNDIERAKHPFPENDLWAQPTMSLEGALQLQLIGKVVFGLPGCLKDCGIQEIETLALFHGQMILNQGINRVRGLPHSFLDDEEKIELLTRIRVKPMFRDALADSVEASLLQELEDVMFETTYPTPPMKPPI
ncbi:hypothetical protein F4777DRAFT_265816 [Nemania sp. FL0916]|nr:hypothetical protein F4777DRAFT_265816 [Nemania sp. FL0916]